MLRKCAKCWENLLNAEQVWERVLNAEKVWERVLNDEKVWESKVCKMLRKYEKMC